MDSIEEQYFMKLSPSEKIVFVLKSHENFGGPQSAIHLQEFLNMKRKHLDSLLSRLTQKGLL